MRHTNNKSRHLLFLLAFFAVVFILYYILQIGGTIKEGLAFSGISTSWLNQLFVNSRPPPPPPPPPPSPPSPISQLLITTPPLNSFLANLYGNISTSVPPSTSTYNPPVTAPSPQLNVLGPPVTSPSPGQTPAYTPVISPQLNSLRPPVTSPSPGQTPAYTPVISPQLNPLRPPVTAPSPGQTLAYNTPGPSPGQTPAYTPVISPQTLVSPPPSMSTSYTVVPLLVQLDWANIVKKIDSHLNGGDFNFQISDMAEIKELFSYLMQDIQSNIAYA